MIKKTEYRVAVLLTGQLRTYTKCLGPLTDFFSNRKTKVGNLDVKIDYFMHTWDVNLWIPNGSDKHRLHEIPFEKVNADQEFIKETLGYLKGFHVDEFTEEKYHNIWGGLLYSHFKANELKSRYEEEHGFTYDLVIKTRPDLFFRPGERFAFNPKLIDNRFIYTCGPLGRLDHEFSAVNVDDCFFFGDSATMDMVSKIYFYAGSLIGEPPFGKQLKETMHYPEQLFGGGTLMGRVCSLLNITPTPYNYRYSYLLVRKPILDFDWSYYTDFNKIEKDSQEYYIR